MGRRFALFAQAPRVAMPTWRRRRRDPRVMQAHAQHCMLPLRAATHRLLDNCVAARRARGAPPMPLMTSRRRHYGVKGLQEKRLDAVSNNDR